MINFFIFEFENDDIFFVSISNHITKLKNMLDKYYPHKIKEYHNFQIVNDFRNNKINENGQRQRSYSAQWLSNACRTGRSLMVSLDEYTHK